MNSANAIYIKQFQDVLKNSGVLIQFIIYPAMAFMMTTLIGSVPGMPDSQFVTMFAGMFVGMALIGSVAPAIAEDRGRNSLRFLLMAGVKSHEYLMGIGGVFLTFSLIGCVAFALLMPGASIIQMLIMILSMMLGCIASITLGAIIGMMSKNEQEAISISSLAGLVISFGPFIANISQNETMLRVFRVLYTMNFVFEQERANVMLENFGIILANVVLLALVFTWAYSKNQNEGKNEGKNEGGFAMNKKAVGTILTAAILGAVGIRGLMWHNAGFIATDNAKVATVTIPVSSNGAGVLERFMLHEGQMVTTDEVLGWVEGGVAMRAPVDGLIIQTNAVQGQLVAPMETVALISDTNSVHVQANIEETDILDIYVGQRAYVSIDTFGRTRFAGHVTSIGSTALPSTSLGSSRPTLLVPVEITVTDDVNLDRLIGVNASVRIPLRQNNSSLVVHAAESEPVTEANEINVAGTVQSATSRNIYTTLGFTIDRIYAQVGDYVQEGQILAGLDTSSLELSITQQKLLIDQARQSGQVALNNARADLSTNLSTNLSSSANMQIVSAESSLSTAQAALRDATLAIERIERDLANTYALYSAGIITSDNMRTAETALENAINRYNDARTNLDNAQATLHAANVNASAAAAQDTQRLRGQVVAAETATNIDHMIVALEKLELQLSEATIVSPISGQVTAVIATEGAVGMGVLFTVEDTNNLEIITSFREYGLASVTPGMEVGITSAGTGDTIYTGYISRINPAATASSASSIVEFEATVNVVPQETNLRIGMNTRLNIPLD